MVKIFAKSLVRVSHMGIVQDFIYLQGPLSSNVAMSQITLIGRSKMPESRAWPFVERLERNRPIYWKRSAFSSGDSHWLSFARTLYMNPQILILDEANSHIDTEHKEIIQKAMAVLQ